MRYKASKLLPYPKELQSEHGSGVKMKDFTPLARDLQTFLEKDLAEVRHKHFNGTSRELILKAATTLDLRFKSHAMCGSYNMQNRLWLWRMGLPSIGILQL